MDRKDFRRIAGTRIEEAHVLLQARRYDGAYYLAGYAVECGLNRLV